MTGDRCFIPLALCLAACAAGTSDERPATFTYVSVTVLQPACATANCHSGIAQAAHLRFDTIDEGYRSLTDEEDLVVPERPDLSKLMKVIGGLETGGEEEDDDLMPPDIPLADDDVDLVRRWILAGAEKD
jgi:hypothetical protein